MKIHVPEQKHDKNECCHYGIQLSLVCKICRIEREQHGKQIDEQVFALIACGGYPTRPIRIIVPSSAGGVHHIIARIWADRVKTSLGAVVVGDRGGGGSSIALNYVAQSQPDGYTLLLGSTSTLVLREGSSNRAYDATPLQAGGRAPMLPAAEQDAAPAFSICPSRQYAAGSVSSGSRRKAAARSMQPALPWWPGRSTSIKGASTCRRKAGSRPIRR
jgi:hypothetical protein